MDRVLAGWRRRVVDPRLPRTLARHLRGAGFSISTCETLTIFDVRGEPRSYSAHQIEHLGASAAGVNAAVIKAWAADLRDLAGSDDYFFSLNRYLFLAFKAAHDPPIDDD
jgi:hypothetical protein